MHKKLKIVLLLLITCNTVKPALPEDTPAHHHFNVAADATADAARDATIDDIVKTAYLLGQVEGIKKKGYDEITRSNEEAVKTGTFSGIADGIATKTARQMLKKTTTEAAADGALAGAEQATAALTARKMLKKTTAEAAADGALAGTEQAAAALTAREMLKKSSTEAMHDGYISGLQQCAQYVIGQFCPELVIRFGAWGTQWAYNRWYSVPSKETLALIKQLQNQENTIEQQAALINGDVTHNAIKSLLATHPIFEKTLPEKITLIESNMNAQVLNYEQQKQHAINALRAQHAADQEKQKNNSNALELAQEKPESVNTLLQQATDQEEQKNDAVDEDTEDDKHKAQQAVDDTHKDDIHQKVQEIEDKYAQKIQSIKAQSQATIEYLKAQSPEKLALALATRQGLALLEYQHHQQQ